MVSEAQSKSRSFPPEDAWPPNDTEESILGTDLHQTTITNLRLGINGIAELQTSPNHPAPWKALSQIALLGCFRADGSLYRTYPDVLVYTRFIDPSRGSLTLEVDGPPVLIAEVLSESTHEADLDPIRGKAYSYARAGVQEYLALDPTHDFLTEGIRAWRLVEGVYLPWEADTEGRWKSQGISVAIGLEGIRVAVYTHEGTRALREGETEQERARLQAEIDRLRRRLADARAI
jgi:hypothetical protein